jgi:hypothetical protein
MIGVFVSDQNSVERFDVTADCGEARKGFAFA